MEYTKLFRETTINDLEDVGEKGINISSLCSDYNVPQGFIITTKAYTDFINNSGISKKIEKELENSDERELQEVANEIQRAIIECEIPKVIVDEIIESYESLSFDKSPSADELLSNSTDALVAVRSSYIDEQKDANLSQQTFLNIKGENRLITSIKVVWAAQFTLKNIENREKNNINPHPKTAIIIQKMVESDVALECYTLNPNSNDDSEIFIKAIFGLGEGFNTDNIPYDSYIINKNGLTISNVIVAEQPYKKCLDKYTNKTSRVLLKEIGKKQKLSDTAIREAARLAKKISTYFKNEQKVELAYQNGEFYVLQSKEIAINEHEISPNDILTESIYDLEVEEDNKQDTTKTYSVSDQINNNPDQYDTQINSIEEKIETNSVSIDIETNFNNDEEITSVEVVTEELSIEKDKEDIPIVDYEDEIIKLENETKNFQQPLEKEKEEELKSFDELEQEQELLNNSENVSIGSVEINIVETNIETDVEEYDQTSDLKEEFEKEEENLSENNEDITNLSVEDNEDVEHHSEDNENTKEESDSSNIKTDETESSLETDDEEEVNLNEEEIIIEEEEIKDESQKDDNKTNNTTDEIKKEDKKEEPDDNSIFSAYDRFNS